MGHDSTPGAIYKVSCPHCGGPVYFVLAGGPRRVACLGCGAPIDFDVVHDGRKWTVRRLRQAPGALNHPPSPP
jgi:hypothetical protein